MRINRDYRIGFYDYDGVYFELFDSERPDQSYSYALANGLKYHVLRISNPDRPYSELRITTKTANYLANLR